MRILGNIIWTSKVKLITYWNFVHGVSKVYNIEKHYRANNGVQPMKYFLLEWKINDSQKQEIYLLLKLLTLAVAVKLVEV